MTHPPVVPSVPAKVLSSTAPRPLLLQNLISQTQTLQSLFTHLSSPVPQIQPISALYTSIYDSTSELADLIDEVYAHQDAYAVLMSKKEEVRGLEKRVKGELRVLERGLRDLQGEVKEGKKIRESIERSEKDPLSSSTLLSVAQNLASHTSAPLSSLLLPQDKAQYMPWPTENAMRAGLLFMMGGSMSGVGDMGKIGDESKDPRKMDVDPVTQIHVQPVHEEDTRRYDPDAIFQLDLNSDSEEDD